MILRRLFCGRLFYIQKMSQDCCPWSLWCSGFQGKLNHNSIIFTPSVLSTLGAISKPHASAAVTPSSYLHIGPHLGGSSGNVSFTQAPTLGPQATRHLKSPRWSWLDLWGFMTITYNYSWTWGATVHYIHCCLICFRHSKHRILLPRNHDSMTSPNVVPGISFGSSFWAPNFWSQHLGSQGIQNWRSG